MTTKARPVASLPGKRSGTADANNRLSTCSRCALGIFRTQPHRWGTGVELGMVHDYDCTEEDESCNP